MTKRRTRPLINFDDETQLVEHACKALVEAGLTLEQVERLRLKSTEPEYIFSKEIVAQRRFATAELLAANLSNAQIAKFFRSSKETVSSDREHIRQVYTNSILQTADHWRARLLEEQDSLKTKALESFEASKRKTIRRVQERNGDEVTTIEEQSMAGDAAFLNVAKGCLQEQAKLLGLMDKRVERNDEEKGYKAFLSSLSKEVKKINEAEKNARERIGALDIEAEPAEREPIEVEVEFDEDGEPIGNSRPMLLVGGDS